MIWIECKHSRPTEGKRGQSNSMGQSWRLHDGGDEEAKCNSIPGLSKISEFDTENCDTCNMLRKNSGKLGICEMGPRMIGKDNSRNSVVVMTLRVCWCLVWCVGKGKEVKQWLERDQSASQDDGEIFLRKAANHQARRRRGLGTKKEGRHKQQPAANPGPPVELQWGRAPMFCESAKTKQCRAAHVLCIS